MVKTLIEDIWCSWRCMRLLSSKYILFYLLCIMGYNIVNSFSISSANTMLTSQHRFSFHIPSSDRQSDNNEICYQINKQEKCNLQDIMIVLHNQSISTLNSHTFPLIVTIRTDRNDCLFYAPNSILTYLRDTSCSFVAKKELNFEAESDREISSVRHHDLFVPKEIVFKDHLEICFLSTLQVTGAVVVNVESEGSPIVPSKSTISRISSIFQQPKVIETYGDLESMKLPSSHSLQGVLISSVKSPSVSESITLMVNSLMDSQPVPTNCIPNATTSNCNIRSAFSYCNSSQYLHANLSCVIVLPSNSQIYMNRSLGPIFVNPPTGLLSLEGNNCDIISPPSNVVDPSHFLIIVSNMSSLVFKMNNCSLSGFGEIDDIYYYYGGALIVRSIQAVILSKVAFHSNFARWGGAVFLESILDSIEIIDCNFYNNSGQVGGGMVLDTAPSGAIKIIRSTFFNNSCYSYGGAILFSTYNRDIDIIECVFQENFVLSGGGALAFNFNNSNVRILDTIFLLNGGQLRDAQSLLGSGGAIFLGGECSNFLIQGSTFDGNSAAYSGAIEITDKSSNITIKDNVFVRNYGDMSSTVISFSGYNVSITNCTFSDNYGPTTDPDLSAILIKRSRIIQITDCIFLNNIPSAIRCALGNELVSVSGSTFKGSDRVILVDFVTGSINRCQFIGSRSSFLLSVLWIKISGNLVILKSTFINNIASTGGAVYISTVEGELSLNDCVFQNNSALEKGGGLYISDFSDVKVSNCQFLMHSAAEAGGAIYLNSQGSLKITQSLFLNNLAESRGGGAIFSSSGSAVVILSCNFTTNSAMDGSGAVELRQSHLSIVVYNCSFISNKAVYSGNGALWIGTNNENIAISNCKFSKNLGSNGGGILLGSDNVYILFDSIWFDHNTALEKGGGMMIDSSNQDIGIRNCHFLNNVAGKGGGLLIESENSVLTISDCTFYDNSATLTGGAISIQSWNEILISTIYIQRNTASDGGAVFAYSDNEIFWTDSDVSLNRALRRGGGIYLAFQNSINYYENLTISYNHAQEGGGIYFQSGNDDFVIKMSLFLGNVARSNGGGFFIQDSNLDIEIRECTFLNNTAGVYGGAIMIQSSNSRFSLISSLLTDNYAELAGGAIHSSLFNDRLSIVDTELRNSVSQFGGALYIGNDHLIVELQNLLVVGSSGYLGGAIYVTPFNDIMSLTNCTFLNSESETIGGVMYTFAEINILNSCVLSRAKSTSVPGIYASGKVTSVSDSLFEYLEVQSLFNPTYTSGALTTTDGDRLILTRSIFRYNYAFYGAAINTNIVGDISISDCLFFSNSGGFGGAVDFVSSSKVSILNTNFTQNTASGGSAMVLESITFANLTALNFISNNCTYDGGAMTAYFVTTFLVSGSNFLRNVAGLSGSAMLVESSATTLIDNSFSFNVAYKAGAVYWLKSSGMKEPTYLTDSQQNFFASNVASYGNNWATEGTKLKPSSYIVNVTTYGVPIPYLLVTILDAYNQVVNTNFETFIEVSVRSNNCHGYVSGEVASLVSAGSANFSTLQAYCEPGSFLSIQFEANDYRISVTVVTLKFRDCVRGEYYSAQECVECESGTYSLDDDKSDLSNMDQISVCKTCPAHASNCYGATLSIKKGYWRISENTDQIQRCPYGEAGCLGGEVAGDDSCAEGYEGPLCAVCSAGYGFKSSSKTCVPCSKSSGLDIADIIFFVALGIIILGLGYYFTRPEIRAQIKSMDDFVLFMIKKLKLIRLKENTNTKELVSYAKKVSSRLRARVKVYITMYQILSGLPFVLDLTFPSPVSFIIAGLNFINISISNSAVVSCSTQSYDFIDSLLLDTIYPIVLVALLALVRWIHISVMKYRAKGISDQLARADLQNRISNLSSIYFTIFLIFTYLILPSVVTKIFQTFRYFMHISLFLPSSPIFFSLSLLYSCDDVDPDNSIPGSDSYMTADYSVSCTSQKYQFGLIWACIMILVYPVGCPALYFYLLYNIRHEISTRDEDQPLERVDSVDITETVRLKQQELLSLKFLYESYHPRFWWWEIAETTQRLLLTGILVLIAQGSAIQIIVGSLLTLTFLHLYARYEPFCDQFILSIKIISYWQIFFVFWIALLIKADFPSISYHSLGICLLFTVFANIIIDFGRVCLAAYRSWIRASSSSSSPSSFSSCHPTGDDHAPGRSSAIVSDREMSGVALKVRAHSASNSSSIDSSTSPFHLVSALPPSLPSREATLVERSLSGETGDRPDSQL